MKVKLQKNLDHAADRVWAVISDFANLDWNGRYRDQVECEGEGVGMLRRVTTVDGVQPLVERLDMRLPETRQIRYSIIEGIAAPVSDFTVEVSVDATSTMHCRITLEINCTADEVVARDMEPLITTIYEDTLLRLDRHLRQHGNSQTVTERCTR